MGKSAIEWTDDTWNPVSGCTRVSAGCDNCYAVKMTKRLEAMGQDKYSGLVNIGKGHFNGVVRCHEDALTIPLKARKPRRWFVNSMSDLFHREVPFEFVDKVFAVMALCPHHTFQILTKRPERMADYLTAKRADFADSFDTTSTAWHVWAACDRWKGTWHWPPFIWKGNLVDPWPLPNIWLGTSVEDQKTADERIPHLLRCPAAVRFLSCEPLLGPVRLGLDVCRGCGSCLLSGNCICDEPSRIHWVIVGGESGPGARLMHPDWARSIRDQCVDAGVPFFFKQWGEWGPIGDAYSTLPTGRSMKACEWTSGLDGSEIELRQTLSQAQCTRLACANDSDIEVVKVGKHKAGRLLDGRTWDEFPEVAR